MSAFSDNINYIYKRKQIFFKILWWVHVNLNKYGLVEKNENESSYLNI